MVPVKSLLLVCSMVEVSTLVKNTKPMLTSHGHLHNLVFGVVAADTSFLYHRIVVALGRVCW